jgi:hypothetical protein
MVPSPIARISHTHLHTLLAQQPWSFWAVDTSVLEPLVPFQPVPRSKLVRVLRSYYTYSDLYLFNPVCAENEVTTIDWQHVPLLDAHAVAPYIITRGAGLPFLGFAPSLDAAQRAAIVLLIPADDETPLKPPPVSQT